MTVALVAGAIFLSAIGYYWLNNVGNLDIALLTYREAPIPLGDGRTETRFPEFKFTNSDYLEIFQHLDLLNGRRLKAHSLAGASNFEIEVSNRPPIRCDDDDSEIAWTDHRTTYEIAYRRPALVAQHRSQLNWTGTVRFVLDYDPGKPNDGKPDLFTITSAKGVAPGTRITVKPSHNPDNCLDADLRDKMYSVPTEFAAVTPSSVQSWFSWISVANAADKVGEAVKNLLNSRDRTSRSIAVQSIQRNPEIVRDEFADLADPSANVNQISDVLTGLVKSGDPSVIFSPQILEPVFELTWNDDAGKRAVARRFLSTEFVARTNVMPRFQQSIKDHWDELVGHYVRDGDDPFSEKRYLALIALRDVYYNGALFRFDQVIDLGAAGQIDETIDSVVKILAEGEQIADKADPRTRYAFAKNTYGRALSLFRYARVKLALAEGAAAKDPSAEAIRSDLVRFESENRPMPLDRFRAGEARDAFATFLKEVAGNEARYTWPHHIAQAKACTALPDALPADCLNAAE